MQYNAEIYVYNEATASLAHWPLPVRILKKLLHAMIAGEGLHALTFHLVRDARIAAENAAHMHCQGPTNILSFPAIHNKKDTHAAHIPHILMLSIDTFRRECFLYGQEPLEHALRLIAHGIAHLLGHDHGDAMWQCCQHLEKKGYIFLEKCSYALD